MKLRRFLAILLAVLLIAALAVPSVFADDTTEVDVKGLAGENTEEEPVEEKESITVKISTAEQLRQFAAKCKLDTYSENMTVLLENDIDLEGEAFSPIPTFSGVFDGQNHSITNFVLGSDGAHQGMFRYLQVGGILKNLKVFGVCLPDGSREQVGGLVGTNRGVINSCSFEGAVMGLTDVGGIAGENYGLISRCRCKGSVDGKRFTGGIAGYSEGIISDCVNEATVNVSINEEAIDLESLSLLDFTSISLTSVNQRDVVTDAGGITGGNSGVLKNCRNYGAIGYLHYTYNVGGISGRQDGYLMNCLNYGTVNGRKDVGGIVGQMEPYLHLLDSDNLADEIGTLTALVNVAIADTNSASQEISSTLKGMNASSGSAEENAGGLDDGGSSGITNRDELLSNMGSISNGLNKIGNTLSSSSNKISADMMQVSAQFNKVMTMISDALGGLSNRQILEDASDDEIEQSVEGKVTGCTNYGLVEGDVYCGGIAGTMGIEYENDLEGDLTAALGAGSIVSNTYQSKCVILRCTNREQVTSKKNNAGGICGASEIGVIMGNESYGGVKSTDGGYVGGICGHSYTTIRSCYAMCDIYGNEYVGGIAGEGVKMQGNVSLVTMNDVTACSGAIAGWVDMTEDEDLKKDETPAIYNNVYINDTYGAIDGISYTGKAEPIRYSELIKREDVPSEFDTLKLKYVADGETVATIEVQYGKSLDLSTIPEVPAKAGYEGVWEQHDYNEMTFGATIQAIYTKKHATIATPNRREGSQQPIALAEGSFSDHSQLSLEWFEDPNQSDRAGTVLERWTLGFTEAGGNESGCLVRYLLPDSVGAKDAVSIFILQDGKWIDANAEREGNHVMFNCRGENVTFCAVLNAADYTTYIIIGIFALLVLAAILLFGGKKTEEIAVVDEAGEVAVADEADAADFEPVDENSDDPDSTD